MASAKDPVSDLREGEMSASRRVVARFADAWRGGAHPEIEPYLAEGPDDFGLLVELVQVDLGFRFSNGEPVRVETYLERFPRLVESRDTVLDLIAGEMQLRRGTDPDLDLDEYLRRFPQFRAELAKQLATTAPQLDLGSETEELKDPYLPRTIVEPSLASAHEIKVEKVADSVGPADATAVDAPPVGRVSIPGYEILGELGRGGMGVVYKARQVGLNRLVALKMILSGVHAGSSDVARFRIEAEAVARLKHPNIVQIYDVGEHDGFPFFSLEFLDGGTLAQKLAEEPLTPHEAARLAHDLALAVDSAHQQGVVHRDLKPGNILLSSDGVSKITDFGLAKRMDSQHGQTQSGAVVGTPGYMAPEQAMGRAKTVGPAVDIYSLGALLYEMLTGRPPFRGETMVDTMLMAVTDEAVPPSQFARVPRDLETICLKCLQKEPEQRYPSARELADELARFLKDEPILARPISAPARLWRWCRRNRVLAGTSGVAALALVALAILLAVNGLPRRHVPRPGENGTDKGPGDPEVVAVTPGRVAADPGDPLAPLEQMLDGGPLTAEQGRSLEVALARLEGRDPPLTLDQQRRSQSLQALALAADPDRHEQAAGRLRELLEGEAPAWPGRLGQAFANLAVADAQRLPEARTALRHLLHHDQGLLPSEKQQLQGALREVVTAQVGRAVPAWRGDWDALLADCREADPADPWVALARAEALLEKHTGRLPDAEQKLVEAAFQGPKSAPTAGYREYVWALMRDSFGESQAAANDLLAAFAAAPLPEALANAGRQRRAVRVFQQASRKLHAPPQRAVPLQPPYAAADVENVYRWLRRAYELCGLAALPPEPALLVQLAVAAWSRQERDDAMILKVSGPLTPEALAGQGADALLVLLARAQLQEATAPEAAFSSYVALLERVEAYQKDSGTEVPAGDLYKRVVLPGIALGAKLHLGPDSEPARRHELASLYANKGRLLGRDAGLAGADRYQQILEAYDLALKLDDPQSPDRAEYILQTALARLHQGDFDLKRLEADSQLARKINPDYPVAHYILGYVRHEQGKAERELNPQREKFEEAVREYTLAIDLFTKRNDPYRERPAVYLERGNVRLALASLFSYRGNDRDACRAALEQAVADARAALALDLQNMEFAYELQGAANEDLGWLLGETQHFTEALRAFKEALGSQPGVARYALNLGRCEYKAAETEVDRDNASLLADALRHLKQAVGQDRKNEKPLSERQLTEAYYWLGRANQRKEQYAEAEAALQQVLGKKDTSQWAKLALEAGVEVALDQAEKHAGGEAAGQYLATAHARLKDLSQYPDMALTLARLEGRAFEVEGKPKQALAVYRKELAREKDNKDLPLLLTKLELLLDRKWRLELDNEKDANAQAVLKEATGAVKTAEDRRWSAALLARAHGVAGLAYAAVVDPDDAEQEKENREQAVSHLRKAVKGTPAHNQKYGWRWRFALAQQLELLAKRSQGEKKEEARKEAEAMAQEALLAGKAPASARKQLQTLLDRLKR